MTEKDWIGVLSVICAILGYAQYIWSIFARNTRPHAFSWIVWGIVTAIVSFAQFEKNAGAGVWATGFSCALCFLVALLAFFRGETNITRTDWAAFAGALGAIPIWLLTKDPLGSVVLVTIIDGLGYYPTIRKSYDKPHQETVFMYTTDVFKYTLALLALSDVTWVTALYPVAIVIFDIGFVAMLIWRRHAIKSLVF